jgi:GH25 family lysozyme M1 (1,4-beta-N-acetylmuramidase)
VRYRYRENIAGVASAQGIDVSNFQGQFDWASAKRAVPNLAFGVFRLTQGVGSAGTNSPDPFAAYNHAAIRDVGLYRMAYHFFDPTRSGAAQARYFLDQHEKLGIADNNALWLDNESTNGMSAGAVAEACQDFMAQLKADVPLNPAGVYSNLNFAQIGADSGLGSYPFWFAFPSSRAPQAPSPWVNWTAWQWGTRFAGGQTVDADAFNGTASDLTSWIESFEPGINPVQGLHATHLGFTSVNLTWNANPAATSYTAHAYSHGKLARTETSTVPTVRMRNLLPAHTYTVSVRAHPGHSAGIDASISVTTRP